MKSVAATVSPPGREGGLAPEFEEKELVLRRLQPSLEAFETSGNSAGATSTGMDIEFSAGQEVCLSIGKRIRNLHNAGTDMAQALGFELNVFDREEFFRFGASRVFTSSFGILACFVIGSRSGWRWFLARSHCCCPDRFWHVWG